MRRLNSERLNTCYRCQKTNTAHLATCEDEFATDIVYTAWCKDCNAPFSYRLRVDVVWDREERI